MFPSQNKANKRQAQRETLDQIDKIKGGPWRLALVVGSVASIPIAELMGIDIHRPAKDNTKFVILMAIVGALTLLTKVVLQIILKRLSTYSRWRILIR